MHNANRPIDTKRDEYRRYLERTGVLQAVSRTLTKLYEEQEKPSDAIGFVFNSIGEACESRRILEEELAAERVKNQKLTEELEEIKAKFAAYKKAEADAAINEDAMLADAEEIPGIITPESVTVAAPEVPVTEATPEPVAALAVPSETATPATPGPIPSSDGSQVSAEPSAATTTAPTSDTAVSSDGVESADVTMIEVTSNTT